MLSKRTCYCRAARCTIGDRWPQNRGSSTAEEPLDPASYMSLSESSDPQWVRDSAGDSYGLQVRVEATPCCALHPPHCRSSSAVIVGYETHSSLLLWIVTHMCRRWLPPGHGAFIIIYSSNDTFCNVPICFDVTVQGSSRFFPTLHPISAFDHPQCCLLSLYLSIQLSHTLFADE